MGVLIRQTHTVNKHHLLPGCELVFNEGIEETKREQTAPSVIPSPVIKDANPFTLFNPPKELDQGTSTEYMLAADTSKSRSIGV